MAEPMTPPTYPNYLKDSPYAELVKRQYEQRRANDPSDKQQDNLLSGPLESAPSSVYSAIRKAKLKASGSAFLLSVDNADKLEDLDLRLPSAWNPNDKGQCVELSSDNRRLKYVGVGKDDTDAASVRANFPMRSQCGIFYFEVEIVSKGRDGYIGIGFCWQSNLLSRLPGWDDHSWGYHGDDGHSFCGSGNGRPYGPKFGTGDTIGCGVNFQDMTAFYTKNGVHLSTAFTNIQGASLYPCVGFRTPGEQVEVNFGDKEFKFDIEHYIKASEEKSKVLAEIAAIPITEAAISGSNPGGHVSSSSTPPKAAHKLTNAAINNMESTQILHDIVLSYMTHHGFCNSAKTFAKDVAQVRVSTGNAAAPDLLENEQDMLQRQEIRHAMVAGDVDMAIELCEKHYPSVLDDNDMLLFKLECHKFIELMRRNAEQQGYQAKPSVPTKSIRPKLDDMEIDDDVVVQRGYKRRRSIHDEEDTSSISSASSAESVDDDDELDGLLNNAMVYGQQLQKNYGRDERPEVQKALVETFSLIAYRDPFKSPVAHVLEDQRVDDLVNELNSAILVSQNRPAMPQLERMYKQSQTAIQELVLAGNGKASVIDVQKDALLG
ncbi:unnamed protein product [Umbelopsis sp. WA50703]